MSKITRAYQKLFASSAGGTQLGKFGSLAAGTPVYTNDPTLIQSLAAFVNGWYAAIVGNNSPPIQDMNSLFYLAFRQIAYNLQQGIPEWDATTDYHIDGFCSSGGVIYKSLVNDNLNNAVTDTTKWIAVAMGLGSAGIVPTVTATRAITSADDAKVIYVDTSAGPFNLTLPAVATMKGKKFTVKDVGGYLLGNPVTVVLNGAETIEGLASNYVLEANGGSWNFISDGVGYTII